jgi:pyrroline-5-carboxylate reductase
MKTKTLFIGGGNMAEALLKGMLSSGILTADSTWVTDIRGDRLQELADTYGVQTSTDNLQAIEHASRIWLCVKPQQMDEVLAPLSGKVADALVISIAAGVPCSWIEAALGGEVRVVRVMPNTPALVGEGMAGVAAGAHAGDAEVQAVLQALTCVGKAVQVQEEDLHAVTALSGSGPAYVFYLIEQLQQAAEELGLTPDTARELAVQTVKGAAALIEQSGDAAATLRERVTSKGGTTAAALETFAEHGVGDGLKAGVNAAARRSRELAEGK